MLMGGDCGLNLVFGYDDSLQKVLARTMLNQEEIFRNQVLELHRLYEIQKVLMKKQLKVSGGESQHSFVDPFSENLKYESLATEMKLSEVRKICLKEHQEMSALMKHGIYDDKESSIQLSLTADADTWQKGSHKRTCNDKIIHSPPVPAIHLEGSSSSGNLISITARGYATHTIDTGAKNELEMNCSSRSRKSDVFDWIFKDGKATLLERKHFHQGVELEQCHEDLSCKNMSAIRKLFTCDEVEELDLNKPLPDESSVDPWIFKPSKCTSSGVSHNEVGYYGTETCSTILDQRQPKVNSSTESSALARQDVTVSTLTTSPSKDACGHICKSTLCSVDIVSVCGPLSDTKQAVNGSGNSRPENGESEKCLPNKSSRRISMSGLNIKKKKEDKLYSHYSTQELLEGTDSNRSPVSCKSDWMADDVSSNTKKTGQCVVDMPNSDSSLAAKKLVVQQNVMPSSEMKSKEKQLAEVDMMVRKGAVSLIYFSLECSARNQEYVPNSRKRNKSCNVVEREVPQSSSESYESIVLKQPECSADEYCVSSTPFEVMRLDEKDHGVKLKRGRRMKDFRKEILPSLASLSRQEITEDIKIMELALRSKEYKKYRSKTAATISPLRSRSSRLRCVGRRYYS